MNNCVRKLTVLAALLPTVLLFASNSLTVDAPLVGEARGVVISIDKNIATLTLEVPESANAGDRVRIDKIIEGEEIRTIRGEVVEVVGADAIVAIDTSKIEVGESARVIAKAPSSESDFMAAIPDDKFAVSDPIANDKLDVKLALKACRDAISEYPEEPRFHAQLGRVLEAQKKPASAILSYERALELEPDYPVVLHNLASLRFFGPEELRDLERARQMYQRAAELGYALSMPVIGSMCRDGSGGQRDFKAAAGWFSIAAEKGNSYSQNALAQCYENGWGVDEDVSKALLWYRSSAELDFAPAMWNLGRVFEYGVGVEPNPETAFDWYGRSAKAGHLDAIYDVAVCYQLGKGISQNTDVAMDLLNKAADKGHNAAMRQIGAIYYQGELVKRDYDLSASWYSKAAKSGDSVSQYQLASMLERGLGVDKNRDAAVAWYQDAARQGHNSSQKRLLKLRKDW